VDLQNYKGKWAGVGHGNREFFGPCEMASKQKASAIWGPKNSDSDGSTFKNIHLMRLYLYCLLVKEARRKGHGIIDLLK
jgi:hypothetical protein